MVVFHVSTFNLYSSSTRRVDDYSVVPFRPGPLCSEAGSLLTRSRRCRRISDHEAPPDASPEAEPAATVIVIAVSPSIAMKYVYAASSES